MKAERHLYGKGYAMLSRVLLAGSLLLFLALSPLAAWPIAQEGGSASEAPIVTTEELTQEGAPQSDTSGTASSPSSSVQGISPETSTGMETAGTESEALEKASEGKRLSRDESAELYWALIDARDIAGALMEASEAKDKEIASLKADLARAEEEAGTKAYLMLDGIVGFEAGIPQFGAGLSIGARIESDLMVEVGADYMVGGMDGYNQWSLDNWEFHAGIGWML